MSSESPQARETSKATDDVAPGSLNPVEPDDGPETWDEEEERDPGRRRSIERRKALLRVVHGFEKGLLGSLTPQVRTPSKIEWMWERTVLYRYSSRRPRRYAVPVMIIPPLMVTPAIFDLRPGHSMVEHLLDRGFDVFLLDFGVPKEEDKDITVDDYVLDFIPAAIERMRKVTGQDEVSLVGWSMGGIFITLYAGRNGPKAHVRNAIVLGSPINFSKMFPLGLLARFGPKDPLYRLVDLFGNIPPWATRNGFKLLAPIGTAMRYKNLVVNLWDRDWVAGYETINHWVDGFIPYPGTAFKQFVTEFVSDDKLRRGEITMGGEKIDLTRIRANVLIFAGTTDAIAPPACVEALLEYVSSEDKLCLHVPVGHIGLVAGSKAKKHIWEPMAEWLSTRSDEIPEADRVTADPAAVGI
ncbi:MAG: alpha/beta fold hydrolase [Myxococcales bacterium]|nr:alpha/beta fold hydrolase [Myxococcales bacterium]